MSLRFVLAGFCVAFSVVMSFEAEASGMFYCWVWLLCVI